jgi:hypothetical protein
LGPLLVRLRIRDDAGSRALVRTRPPAQWNCGGISCASLFLIHVASLPRLTLLRLGFAAIDDAGMEYLQRLDRLQVLDLEETRITDSGLKHLRRLRQLQELQIDGTLVTDAGLKNLEGLKKLRNLFLDNSRTTPEGVKKLQQALPNCKIER